MKVNKKYLLIIAGIIWFIAGFNITRIGFQAGRNHWTGVMILLALAIYLLFHNIVFRKMVKKHAKRITEYEESKQNIFHFFDKKSYFIMIFMISFGLLLRYSHLCSDNFIATFYFGLGMSLVIAGVSFFLQYLRFVNKEKKFLKDVV